MSKKIALYGIGGLYNYGCEAIVRGTVANLRIIDANCDITYYSRCFEYDSKQINDLNIKVKNIETPNNIFKKIINKSIDIFKIPKVAFSKKEFINIINENDIIVSIGGDIYSIPKYKREKSTYTYVNRMVEFGEVAKKLNKKVVIYGASIGPFGEYKKAKDYFINHLNKLDLIVCRENYSIEYLKNNNVKDNVVFLPDPAYLVGNENFINENKEYIGVNLSALSLHEIYGQINNESIKKICDLLRKINNETGSPIMLIPHVYSPFDELDNDYKFMKKIYDSLDDDIKNNVELVNPTSFIDVKNYISKCKLVVAARMHCAVNAIIENVPTVFLSYSIKSKGMAEFVYGDLKWFLQLDEIEEKLIKTIKDIDVCKNEVNKDLKKRKEEINNHFSDNNLSYTKLKEIILSEREF